MSVSSVLRIKGLREAFSVERRQHRGMGRKARDCAVGAIRAGSRDTVDEMCDLYSTWLRAYAFVCACGCLRTRVGGDLVQIVK